MLSKNDAGQEGRQYQVAARQREGCRRSPTYSTVTLHGSHRELDTRIEKLAVPVIEAREARSRSIGRYDIRTAVVILTPSANIYQTGGNKELTDRPT